MQNTLARYFNGKIEFISNKLKAKFAVTYLTKVILTRFICCIAHAIRRIKNIRITYQNHAENVRSCLFNAFTAHIHSEIEKYFSTRFDGREGQNMK